MALAVHGDGAFLHRFQQRSLRLRGRPIDLIRQDQVREDRAGSKREFVGSREQRDAGDVGRHQVGSELDPPELHVERECERPDE